MLHVLPVSLSSGNVVRSRSRGVVPSILLSSICSRYTIVLLHHQLILHC